MRFSYRVFNQGPLELATQQRTAFAPRDLTETFGEAPDDALPSSLPV